MPSADVKAAVDETALRCGGAGTWYPESRMCELREGDRRWQAVTPTFAKMLDGLGGCPKGYGEDPQFPGYCSAGLEPGAENTVRLNPEQAEEFNRRQQAKRDMQDAVEAGVRAAQESR